MAVITKGDRKLSLQFDTFPERARQKLKNRIESLVATLEGRSEQAAPYRTGALRSEIRSRTFADQPNRVAGYVSVYAPGNPKEYPKAATLEYGSNKVRRILERGTSLMDRLGRPKRRVIGHASKAAHIEAYMFLRKPLEEMRPEIEASLNEALAEVTAEANE